MAGSWLPDDLRRKIEEEKQSTTSSSSNGWFQSILDLNNKNKTSLDVHLQSREQFFDHCKRKFEEDTVIQRSNIIHRKIQKMKDIVINQGVNVQLKELTSN
jgi:hypothetical protein